MTLSSTTQPRLPAPPAQSVEPSSVAALAAAIEADSTRSDHESDAKVRSELAAEADRLPNLIKPLFGSPFVRGNNILRLGVLLQDAPQLQRTRTDQIAALPLGARTSLDPWTDQMRMALERARRRMRSANRLLVRH